MTKICDLDPSAVEKLSNSDDRSGIGVHYVDAYIKPMNATLADGTVVSCKRRGLKIVLTVGDRTGEGLMRRIDVSQDPVIMLDAALREAARAAGVELRVEDGGLYVEDREGSG